MDQNLECLPHCSKSGWWLESDIVILAIRYKVEMCRGCLGSIECGRWKYSGIKESMTSAIFSITDIIPCSAR